MNATQAAEIKLDWLKVWTQMTAWERHCHRTGDDPDDFDSMDDFYEAEHEEAVYGKDY